MSYFSFCWINSRGTPCGLWNPKEPTKLSGGPRNGTPSRIPPTPRDCVAEQADKRWRASSTAPLQSRHKFEYVAYVRAYWSINFFNIFGLFTVSHICSFSFQWVHTFAYVNYWNSGPLKTLRNKVKLLSEYIFCKDQNFLLLPQCDISHYCWVFIDL